MNYAAVEKTVFAEIDRITKVLGVSSAAVRLGKRMASKVLEGGVFNARLSSLAAACVFLSCLCYNLYVSLPLFRKCLCFKDFRVLSRSVDLVLKVAGLGSCFFGVVDVKELRKRCV